MDSRFTPGGGRGRALPLPVSLVPSRFGLRSVGFSQPWRFVLVDDQSRRQAVVDEFRACNADALKSYSGTLAACYAKLKLAGLGEAPCQFAVFADGTTAVGHGLGRRTMPEM